MNPPVFAVILKTISLASTTFHSRINSPFSSIISVRSHSWWLLWCWCAWCWWCWCVFGEAAVDADAAGDDSNPIDKSALKMRITGEALLADTRHWRGIIFEFSLSLQITFDICSLLHNFTDYFSTPPPGNPGGQLHWTLFLSLSQSLILIFPKQHRINQPIWRTHWTRISMDGFVFYFSFAAGRCSTQVVCTMRVSERERIHICRLPMCFVVVTIVCFTHTNEQRPDDEPSSYLRRKPYRRTFDVEM